eukprot:TRINITY_DN55576_c0_g1_i1.p1 TRINITY_DN55576_c0_g1~~TRINITY_DN55576_c0_g1_i1.p1  ORF type:complete len:168 (-),score=12.05 TRINITY_DN55576_c0_g1_i1:326-829(-)
MKWWLLKVATFFYGGHSARKEPSLDTEEKFEPSDGVRVDPSAEAVRFSNMVMHICGKTCKDKTTDSLHDHRFVCYWLPLSGGDPRAVDQDNAQKLSRLSENARPCERVRSEGGFFSTKKNYASCGYLTREERYSLKELFAAQPPCTKVQMKPNLQVRVEDPLPQDNA